jgi:hypothetical protein
MKTFVIKVQYAVQASTSIEATERMVQFQTSRDYRDACKKQITPLVHEQIREIYEFKENDPWTIAA